MISIVYDSGPLAPEFLELRLGIVNSASRGRLPWSNPLPRAKAT